jgi:hypothetical protein
MRKLLYSLALFFTLGFTPIMITSCATTMTNSAGQTVTLSPLEQSQDVATKATLVLGQILVTTPGVLKTAYSNSKMSKTDFNNSVDIYNRALASYTILNQALQTTIKAGLDPSSAAVYQLALTQFLTDKTSLDNLLTALGQPVTGAK